jgi:hypothetical protein
LLGEEINLSWMGVFAAGDNLILRESADTLFFFLGAL